MLDGSLAWLSVPRGSDSSYTPEKVLQGAGVQVLGDSGRVMASERQSSALRSQETGKPCKPKCELEAEPSFCARAKPCAPSGDPAALLSRGAECWHVCPSTRCASPRAVPGKGMRNGATCGFPRRNLPGNSHVLVSRVRKSPRSRGERCQAGLWSLPFLSWN